MGMARGQGGQGGQVREGDRGTELAWGDLKLQGEVVQVVVKTLYPFSQDITAYSYQLLALFD